MKRVRPALQALITIGLLHLVLACQPDTLADMQIELEEFTIEAWPLDAVLPGTRIQFRGTGFLDESLGYHRLVINPSGQQGLQFVVPLSRSSSDTLEYRVSGQWLDIFPIGTEFAGAVSVERILSETGQVDRIQLPAAFQMAENLEPILSSIQVENDELYPGDTITLTGSGFILPGEGHSVAIIEGALTTLVPPETRSIQVVLPITGVSRETLQFELTPDIFGIRPGTFEGSIRLSNETPTSQVEGNVIEALKYPFFAPRIEAITPTIARRGQSIIATGRGFLPTDPPFEATTLFRLEGEFEAGAVSDIQVYDGATALALFPDSFTDNTEMKYILRVTQTPAGALQGLGLLSGTFRGAIRPLLISGAESVLGEGPTVELSILPQRQVVFIDYLPGFSATVELMGLAILEPQIKKRILDVCNRDYEGVNVEFRDTRPTDYSEYSIVEVGGQDPNQAGLFGLDNTAGKDVGNIRFNDIIGGTNAETRERGYFAFGGVFVQSFFQLSPSIPGIEPLPIARYRFDEIFGPFMRLLGGRPVKAANSFSFEAREAVRVLGNLVGNTVVHEIGHSLGLSNIDGEFHNIGDNKGWLMDSGTFRPFAERAEIDGASAAVFSPNNRSYLERILPSEPRP